MARRSENALRRVLVTGLDGFTGRYVGAELETADCAVLSLERASDGNRVDLLDADAVRETVRQIRPQAVIHLAGIAFAAHGDAEGLYRTNIVGTRNLLSALAQLPKLPSMVVLASSAHVYGNAADERLPLDESSKVHPASDYAVSKLAMEYMARTWSDRLPVLITRPFNYTGVGQDMNFLVPKIVEHFRRGERRTSGAYSWMCASWHGLIVDCWKQLAAAICSISAPESAIPLERYWPQWRR